MARPAGRPLGAGQRPRAASRDQRVQPRPADDDGWTRADGTAQGTGGGDCGGGGMGGVDTGGEAGSRGEG